MHQHHDVLNAAHSQPSIDHDIHLPVPDLPTTRTAFAGVYLAKGPPMHPRNGSELDELIERVKMFWFDRPTKPTSLSNHGACAKPEPLPEIQTIPTNASRAIGNFKLIREIGRGAMGVVYEASDTRSNQRVALKVLFDPDGSTIAIKRFHEEIQRLGRLNHRNIVRLYTAAPGAESPYFSMELIKGRTLAEQISRTPFSGLCAAKVMLGVSDALQHAHAEGIIHLDLKPENIMLRPNDTPVLIDFGISKDLFSIDHYTDDRTRRGTPEYMSPEQVLGNQGQLGPATDIWSLGVILYQMLTQQVPFYAVEKGELYKRITTSQHPTLVNSHHCLDEELETIYQRCLDKDPQERYLSAEALTQDLRAYLSVNPSGGSSVDASVPFS